MKRTWIALRITMLLSACGGTIDDQGRFLPAEDPTVSEGVGEVTEDEEQQQPVATIDVEGELFPTSCGAGGCHAAQYPAANLDLVSPGIAERLVDVASACDDLLLIDSTGAPSYFFEKVTSRSPACGAPMPWGKTLSTEEVEAIADWIVDVSTASTSTTVTK